MMGKREGTITVAANRNWKGMNKGSDSKKEK